jgi:hypothetical protein
MPFTEPDTPTLFAPADGAEAGGPARQWRLAPDVLWCTAPPFVAVLSLRRGRYFTLAGPPAITWSRIAAGIADPATVLDDRSTRECVALARAGLITASPLRQVHRSGPRWPTPTGRPTGLVGANPRLVPSSSDCLATLVAVRTMLATRSLIAVLRWAHRGGGSGLCPDAGWRADLSHRVDLAAALCPFGAECLVRGLAWTRLARGLGVEAAIRFGIAPLPFAAHAWVEVANTPANESPEGLSRYVALSCVVPALYAE